MQKSENNLDSIIAIEKELAVYDGKDKVITAQEMKDKLAALPPNHVRLRTGIPTLDSKMGGFIGGELTTISGKTGQGKSTFARTLTKEFAEVDSHSLWFTYEESAVEFLNKFGDSCPALCMPSILEENTMDWLTKRIWEAKLKYKIEAVFIDHLHYLVDMRSRHNMSLEIGSIMRSLKKIAVRFNLAVFVIAHTALIREDKEMDVDSLRDSTFVGQESNNVLMIWRNKDSETEATLKICKDRKFGIMGHKIPLKKVGQYLKEVELGSYTAPRERTIYT